MSQDATKYDPPILCVSCGEPINEMSDSENFDLVDSGVVGTLDAGYGSTHDGDTIQVGICDDCLDQHLKIGRVKVIKSLF